MQMYLFFVLLSIVNAYPSLFNMDYEDRDSRVGLSVRRCNTWIENQRCGSEEICIHYQGQYIECVPSGERALYDFNRSDIMRRVSKRNANPQTKKNQNASRGGWPQSTSRQMNYNAKPQHRRYWSMPYTIFK